MKFQITEGVRWSKSWWTIAQAKEGRHKGGGIRTCEKLKRTWRWKGEDVKW